MSLPPWISGKRSGAQNSSEHSIFPRTSKIKNAKKPKSRPPKSLRETMLLPVRSLPAYSGPYSVGTMEIEVPVEEPRSFSDIQRDGHYILQMKTVLLTIYYPASPPVGKKRPSRELWLGRPRLGMTMGFGHFATVGPLTIPVFLPTMFTKLPAFRNAPLSTKFPDQSRPGGGSADGEPEEPPKFPLMIFSHGLGGTRTAYSSVCGEFASYGFVVVAVEHRDGSGPRSYVNKPKGGEKELDNQARRGSQQRNTAETHTWHDTVDYIFPKGNHWDTSPNNEKGVDHKLRGAQLDFRLSEIEEAYKIVCQINDGNGEDIERRNLRRKGHKASSSMGLDGVRWQCWKDRIRTDYAVAAGHSFGAATVVDMLRHEKRFNWVSQGIVYDIWGGGTRPPSTTDDKIHAPILAINSEAFTYWPKNYELVKSLIEEARPSPAWLMTVRGTIHVSQSDFSILYPNMCSFLMKMTANPERALDINVNASLEFLTQVMPTIPDRIKKAFPKEDLLQEQMHRLESIPTNDQHKPKDDKWIAARLSIPHEFTWRVFPGLARKMARKNKPDDDDSQDNEVWLHHKPDEEAVRNYTARAASTSSASLSTASRQSQDANCEPASVPPNAGDDTEEEKKEKEKEWKN